VKLALIGNCAYQALIDDQARVRWLCWPRFDSSFVFGPLLDEERGGECSVAPIQEKFDSKQSYLPLTNILRTEIRAGDHAFEVIDFAPRFRQFERFFKPTMLVRRVRRLTGAPTIRIRCRPVYYYGLLTPDAYLASNHIHWLLPTAQIRLTTNAPLNYVLEGRPFALAEDVYLVVTWGEPLEAPLRESCESFLEQTRCYWETWTKHISLPDQFQEEVIRSALVLKLHQYEDTGAITAATTSSLPEHPGSGRNWDYRYCWLRDTFFTLWALRRLGHFEEMEGFVSYLLNLAEAAPARLQPVYGISGEPVLTEQILKHLSGYQGSGPVRAGNSAWDQHQHDVYGEMIASISPLFVDVRFRNHLGQRSTTLLRALLEHVDRHLEAPDAGLWEKRIDPKLHTFTVLMHWIGATIAAEVGRRRGDARLRSHGDQLASRARAIIERAWREKLGFYADSPNSDDADASLMLMVNLGFLHPAHPHAERHVRALAEQLRASSQEHLLYRYRHHDGLGETHATFAACGFWYAEALARLDLRQDADKVFRALLSHGNHVGLFSEDIDPADGSQCGNFPQTYSHVGVINAAFAISPPLGFLL
jgi:GH15 family glucan-1,4-alpha-glucosidase